MTFTMDPPFSVCLAGQHRWPVFWSNLQLLLREAGYNHDTRRVYRSVLRRFARHVRRPPCEVRKAHVDDFLAALGRGRGSAQWLAMNISILRTVFDKCCAQNMLEGRICPKRTRTLPPILSENEIRNLLRAVRCPRDALLVSFLYGCGLRPGEAVRLRWGDVNLGNGTVCVDGRVIRLPQAVHGVLEAGVDTFATEDWIFPGSGGAGHLTTRSLTRILGAAAQEAGIDQPVTGMTLRHSYAVHQLQNGGTIREVQEVLGHLHVVTTMRYLGLVPPAVSSPADRMAGILPNIPTHAAASPFGEDRSSRRLWLLGWLKSRFVGLRRRPPGLP